LDEETINWLICSNAEVQNTEGWCDKLMYNFDEIIDRRNTNAMSTDGFRGYIFGDNNGSMTFPYKDEEFIRMWVADMDFCNTTGNH
jgi:hypothetical protein